MTTVAIGIPVHAGPASFLRTLEAIARHTPSHELVIIPEGADEETQAALQSLTHCRVLEDRGARGGAAALNTLARETTTDIVLLLESGAVPGPYWLDALLAALSSSRRAGLAGPTTNRSWNEQGRVRGRLGGSDEEIASMARHLRRQYGAACHVLAPLYSLADFCYAVRREVFEAIGPADEAYGRGPCWEMDFNLRAARAGIDGLWAQASYVWRSPFTARRASDEAGLFDASRRRYQDRYCAARKRGTLVEYRDHCRGDECPDFAPRLDGQFISSPALLPPGDPPLVSCIMPTYNRRAFVPLALACFSHQTYPRRELVIVDDGSDPIGDLLQDIPDVRYVRLQRRHTIGAKRNIACREARGEVIAHWDDDDWYGPERLAVQVDPILRGEADITGMENRLVLALPEQRFWTVDRRLHQSMFVGDIHGGTICYRTSILHAGLRYPDSNIGEDAHLLRQAMRHRMRMKKVPNDGVFVYVRHRANTWRFTAGSFIDPSGWHHTARPDAFTPEHLAAYHDAAAIVTSSSAPRP